MVILRMRVISTLKLPVKANREAGGRFLAEVKGTIGNERPCVVIDCSSARAMDDATVMLLLNSLEIAMKRNGDVRLANVCAEAHRQLEAIGADRLFMIFSTPEEATESFRRRVPHGRGCGASMRESRAVAENAA